MSLRLDVVAAAVGTTLLATTIALSATYSRAESDLDWSNFGLGIIAALGLLGIAAAAFVMVRDDALKSNLVAWPGALGAIGAGLMIAVAMDDSGATGYVAGLATVAISAGGFFVVRRGAFVVAAVIGLLVTYANLVDDVFGVEDGGDNLGITSTAALLVFAIAVTAGGWSFSTRDISGVFVGAVTAFGFVSVLAGLLVAALFQQLVGGLSGDLGVGGAPDKNRFDNDVYVIVLFTLVLVAGWAACSWMSGHVGYLVLILVTLTSVLPLATAALAVEHPSYWGLGIGVLGAVVLAVVGMRGLGMFPTSAAGSRRLHRPA
ncbi:MAG: hypothetical protein ACRDO7_14025 [Nocardioidaceae bacterium]